MSLALGAPELSGAIGSSLPVIEAALEAAPVEHYGSEDDVADFKILSDASVVESLATAVAATKSICAGQTATAIEQFNSSRILAGGDMVSEAAVNGQATKTLLRYAVSTSHIPTLYAFEPEKAVPVRIVRPFVKSGLQAVRGAEDILENPAHDEAMFRLYGALSEGILPGGNGLRGVVQAVRGIAGHARMHEESTTLDARPPVTTNHLVSAIGVCLSRYLPQTEERISQRRETVNRLTGFGVEY